MAIAKSGASEVGEPFSWSWFSPAGLTLSAFIAGLSFSIFAFWGWDTALTVNEESKNSDTTPGRAALLCVLSILLTYLLVSVATQMYAGRGRDGTRPEQRDVSDNVFGNLAVPILGIPLDLALFLAVLASSSRQPDHHFSADHRALARTGASIGGVGLVLVLGLGLILVGLIFMAILRVRQPAFFRGETIIHESAHAMRPHEHLVS